MSRYSLTVFMSFPLLSGPINRRQLVVYPPEGVSCPSRVAVS